MLQELVIHHVRKNKKRHLVLNQESYRLGKALDNDIVLLDSDCPSYVGVIEKNEYGYGWQELGEKYNLNQPHHAHGFTFQIQDKKNWISALIFSALFLSSLLFFQWVYQNDHINPIAAMLPARGTYGNLNASGSTQPVEHVEFKFNLAKEKYTTLHYTSGNLSKVSDLQININGQFLGFAPASPRKWNVETQTFIPEALLKEKGNEVAFVFQGEKSQNWAIRDIYIEASNEAPSQQNGKDFLLIAKKLLRERSVKKGNLVRAQQVLDQAAQFYQARNEEPPEALTQMIVQVQREKQHLILKYAELIRKNIRGNEKKKARDAYNQIMDELIDPVDSDRIAFEKEFE